MDERESKPRGGRRFRTQVDFDERVLRAVRELAMNRAVKVGGRPSVAAVLQELVMDEVARQRSSLLRGPAVTAGTHAAAPVAQALFDALAGAWGTTLDVLRRTPWRSEASRPRTTCCSPCSSPRSSSCGCS